MRIAFNKPVETMPLYCDSVGYDWDQPPSVNRIIR